MCIQIMTFLGLTIDPFYDKNQMSFTISNMIDGR